MREDALETFTSKPMQEGETGPLALARRPHVNGKGKVLVGGKKKILVGNGRRLKQRGGKNSPGVR